MFLVQGAEEGLVAVGLPPAGPQERHPVSPFHLAGARQGRRSWASSATPGGDGVGSPPWSSAHLARFGKVGAGQVAYGAASRVVPGMASALVGKMLPCPQRCS